jgi:hypothetical protein
MYTLLAYASADRHEQEAAKLAAGYTFRKLEGGMDFE